VLAAEEHSGQVDVEDALPDGELGVDDRLVSFEQDARVVDQHLHAAEALGDAGVERGHARLVGDVDAKRLGAATGLVDLAGDRVRPVLEDVAAGDVRSFLGEPDRARPADAAAAARDRAHPAVEPTHAPILVTM
jgi:hypothetical protein